MHRQRDSKDENKHVGTSTDCTPRPGCYSMTKLAAERAWTGEDRRLRRELETNGARHSKTQKQETLMMMMLPRVVLGSAGRSRGMRKGACFYQSKQGLAAPQTLSQVSHSNNHHQTLPAHFSLDCAVLCPCKKCCVLTKRATHTSLPYQKLSISLLHKPYQRSPPTPTPTGPRPWPPSSPRLLHLIWSHPLLSSCCASLCIFSFVLPKLWRPYSLSSASRSSHWSHLRRVCPVSTPLKRRPLKKST